MTRGPIHPKARARVAASHGEMFYVTDPDRLRAAMAATNPKWSQRTLAAKVGCGASTIGWMTTPGNTRRVAGVLARAVAEAVGVPLAEIFTLDQPSTDRPAAAPETVPEGPVGAIPAGVGT